MRKIFTHTFLLWLVLLAFAPAFKANAQYKVRGNVYDSSGRYPLEAVTVLSTSGRGTTTDVTGKYEIDVAEKDSIWFSYLGKPTRKYPVLKMNDPLNFDLSIQVSVPVLREVKVMPRNYRQDSIQNRLDYAKAFDFRRPNIESLTSIGPTGAGIDLDELIRVFQFRRNKYMQKFQDRLLQQERDKFVEHRFNKQLIRKLTGLADSTLNNFYVIYKPSYEFALYASDYDFQSYIKNCYALFVHDYPDLLRKENN